MAEADKIVVLIRLIRSFEYRNVKQLVLHITSDITVEELLNLIKESK